MNGDTIKQIGDQLSRVFRHLLPGLVVVGAFSIGHPHFFQGFRIEPWPIAFLAGISLTVGNVWYVLHRYLVHQLIDCMVYRCRNKKKFMFDEYCVWLRQFVHDSFTCGPQAERLQTHLHFRSAQIILLFIVSEVTALLSFWSERGTFFYTYDLECFVAAGAIFIFAFVQYVIGDVLDRYAVRRHRNTLKCRCAKCSEVVPYQSPSEMP